MFNVMIVDDEYMLLRGYRKIIDWASLRLEVKVTEQNPLVALTQLQELPIDILISDMNMPELDGPSFVAQAKKIQPDMALIVISGYSDFDYVKAGLQQGAVNYLKKPIDTDELIEALQSAIEHIEKQKNYQQMADLAMQAQTRALLQSTDMQNSEDLMQKLNISCQQNVRLIGILNPKPPRALVAYLQTIFAVKGFFLEGHDYIIIFQGTENQLRQFIKKAPSRVSNRHRPMIIGDIVVVGSFRQAYQQLEAEIARQYFFESPYGLQWLTNHKMTDDSVILPGYAQVKAAIKGFDLSMFKKWFVTQTKWLENSNASDVLVRQFALIVVLVLNEKLLKSETKTKAIVAINQATVVSEIERAIVNVFQETSEVVQRHLTTNVATMCQIVENRYSEPLSLGMIAQELHLNAVYLGQLFKQDMGRSFSQYLNDYRINIALDMLQNTKYYDVNYIASFVGYQNHGYFYRLFKLQTGMTPSEYREGTGVIDNEL
ncbi:response regulator transcription factor [Latilactobacillus graminis]|uniref:Response regulator n=2 Tax=Latilactobacillus graminis TaxID=60519 RepID=A0AA89I232_9LACO|nr:response regulator [Latilactobacillus graminis]KRM24189.1 response regulator [Latilactobacillus graminis DSM 20719]QFP78828.1 response regulator [Latilactobacillus graminis]